MGYQLGLDVPESPPHPSVRYETLQKAITAARAAIDNGYYEVPDQGVVIGTGSGTLYKIASDEFIAANKPSLQDFSHVLSILWISNGVMYKKPFGYNSMESVSEAVETILAEGVLQHCGREHHEYTYLQERIGFVYMKMTLVAYLAQDRAAAIAELRTKQGAERLSQQEGTPEKPLIII